MSVQPVAAVGVYYGHSLESRFVEQKDASINRNVTLAVKKGGVKASKGLARCYEEGLKVINDLLRACKKKNGKPRVRSEMAADMDRSIRREYADGQGLS